MSKDKENNSKDDMENEKDNFSSSEKPKKTSWFDKFRNFSKEKDEEKNKDSYNSSLKRVGFGSGEYGYGSGGYGYGYGSDDDWVGGRDDRTFTRKTQSYSGWQDRIQSGRSYSSYFFDREISSEKKELMEKGYQMAKNFVVAMNPNTKVLLRFSEHQASDTKAQAMNLNTAIFDDADLSSEEKLDVFIGEAVHETSHLCYTDFEVEVPRADVLVSALMTIIEDERVEGELAEEYPGYVSYIGRLKQYFFEKKYLTALTQISVDPKNMNEAQKILNVILHSIRYPKNVTAEEKDKYKVMLKEIRAVLTPFPKTTQDSKDAAYKIKDIIEKKYKDEIDKMSEEMKQKMLGDMKGEGGEGGESGEGGEGMSKKFEKMTAEEKKALMKEMVKKMIDDMRDAMKNADAKGEKKKEEKEDEEGKEGKGTPSGKGKESKSDKSSEISKTFHNFMEKAREEAVEKLEKEFGMTLNEMLTKLMKEVDMKMAKGTMRETHETGIDAAFKHKLEMNYGGKISGENTETVFKKIKDNRAAYLRDKAEVSRTASTLSRILSFKSVDKKLVNKSMRSGYLDTNKLAEAKQGIPTVYERFGHTKSNKIAVCLLVDESGSMGGSKIAQAQKTAILFREALLRNKDIELFIYGHSADISFHKSVDMRIYCEPNYDAPYSLGSVTRNRLANNADGYAISEAAHRVRKFTNRPCVMFVISDGQPAASIYSGGDGQSHTKKAVNEVTEKMNMQVIQIAIEMGMDPKTMFKHFVKLTNIEQLPRDLGRIMKKVISDMMVVETVNY